MKNKLFLDKKMREEFLDRYEELHKQYLKSSVVVPVADDEQKELLVDVNPIEPVLVREKRIAHPADNLREILKEKNLNIPISEALLMEQFNRPAYLVQNNSFDTRNSPSASEQINNRLNNAKTLIEKVIPSVGRINLHNHSRLSWVGSGWVVAKNVLVTNRHVAAKFAGQEGDGFVFIQSEKGIAKALLDTVSEYGSQQEKLYRLRKVLWIAPPSEPHDVAFLSIDEESRNDEKQPDPIELIDTKSFEKINNDHWIAVIGYPSRSAYDDIMDQQRIFKGIYGVKRILPGQIKGKNFDKGIVEHDASTLIGSSGGPVLDLTSGKAIALHFGSTPGENNIINKAVAAPVIQKLLQKHIFS
jgi:endonuclease G